MKYKNQIENENKKRIGHLHFIDTNIAVSESLSYQHV